MSVLRFQPRARRMVDNLIGEATDDDAAFIQRTQDPFRIENACTNPAGHIVISSCGAIVCAHCPVVFWS